MMGAPGRGLLALWICHGSTQLLWPWPPVINVAVTTCHYCDRDHLSLLWPWQPVITVTVTTWLSLSCQDRTKRPSHKWSKLIQSSPNLQLAGQNWPSPQSWRSKLTLTSEFNEAATGWSKLTLTSESTERCCGCPGLNHVWTCAFYSQNMSSYPI
jgi:hypothetical protein